VKLAHNIKRLLTQMRTIRSYQLALALAFVTGPTPTVWAQTAQGDLRAQFEVATIKPHSPSIPGFGIAITGRRFTGVNVSVSSLVAFAYALHPRQVVDAPGWMESERFDIVAEAPEGGGASMTLLVQGLLTGSLPLRIPSGAEGTVNFRTPACQNWSEARRLSRRSKGQR
jgi:hypothetical protein